MRRKYKWIIGAGFLAFLAVLPALYSAVSYALATYQYETLVALQPAAKADVERVLFLCSARQIGIEQSTWGQNARLTAGESCWQYKVLWRDPIEVVYDDQGHVKHIYASFE